MDFMISLADVEKARSIAERYILKNYDVEFGCLNPYKIQA